MRAADLYKTLGAHLAEDGKSTRFSVYAPNAQKVHVYVQNEGDEGFAPFELTRQKNGVFATEVVGAKEGTRYLLAIVGKDGLLRIKTDPFSFYNVPRKSHEFKDVFGEWACVVWDHSKYKFESPIPDPNITKRFFYELHPGTFEKGNPDINILDLVDRAIPRLKALKITHLSLMPLMHHPDPASMGYLVGGFYSINYRHGNPDDYKKAIDRLHANGIRVVWDLVHAHATEKSETGLENLDGTQLYFYDHDPAKNQYGSHDVDFRSPHTFGFFLSNARFWAEQFKLDGFRVDAIDLYRRFYRKDVKYDKPGGGLAYLKALNHLLATEHPHVLRIAEDTSFIYEWGKGAGFQLSWDVAGEHHMHRFLAAKQAERVDGSKYFLEQLLQPATWIY
jgi:1,4-alpha-glucan branching enzyme